jgi:hypothetical protein
MRDPDMVSRAHRAALALERAWERWRIMHGLSDEPMPPVSSYVGYSIEEPWGRPRVVFGVDAREAELLAALLDCHECVGPFYRPEPPQPAAGRPADPDLVTPAPRDVRARIPAQARREPGERDPGDQAAALAGPPVPGQDQGEEGGGSSQPAQGVADREQPGYKPEPGTHESTAGTAPGFPEEPPARDRVPAAGEREAARRGSPANHGGREPLAGGQAPPLADAGGLTATQRLDAEPGRADTLAAELAGWASGELPGQASARLAAWSAIGGVPASGHHPGSGHPPGPARAVAPASQYAGPPGAVFADPQR